MLHEFIGLASLPAARSAVWALQQRRRRPQDAIAAAAAAAAADTDADCNQVTSTARSSVIGRRRRRLTGRWAWPSAR